MSPQRRRQPVPPELMDELLCEILLRIPPDEPAHLVHAALVCKPWLRILSDPVFNRSYRERHRRPPLLGFIHNLNLHEKGPIPRFVSTTAFPCSQPALDCCFWWALDSRHGRVLVHRFGPTDLAVWDPITCNLQQLPEPLYPHSYFTGAVICAVAGCDHLDCTGGGLFRVVFVGTDDEESFTWASVYSSETRGWSTMATADPDPGYYVETKPSVLVGEALYFTLEFGMAILKYDLARHAVSVIDAPEVNDNMGIVMAAEDGGLGFAAINGRNLHLCLWSCLTGDDDDGSSTRWTLCRSIHIQSILPICNPQIGHDVIGFAEGTDTIFLKTDAAVFTLEIKSGKTKKVGERGAYYAVLPYMSFCAPVCAAGCLPSP